MAEIDETIALYRDRLTDCATKLYALRREHEGDIAAAAVLSFDELKKPGDSPFFRYLAGSGLELLSDLLEDSGPSIADDVVVRFHARSAEAPRPLTSRGGLAYT